MGMVIYNCYFHEDVEIRFIVDKIHPLKFLFCERGEITHRFENETETKKIDFLENIIVASSHNNGHILKFKGKTEIIINSLEIDREKFAVTMDCELRSLDANLENLFRDITAKKDFYHHGNYSFQMADLFLEIGGSPRKDFISRISMEGNAYKMLKLQIPQYNDDMDSPENKSMLRKLEISLVIEASGIINNEILDFKTVPELALLVGINSNKLQNGFKELYGTTVNDYVHNRRLDLARGLLKNSEFTISEIVFMIGLASKSYFSKIFKEKYGLSPSLIRRNGNSKKILQDK